MDNQSVFRVGDNVELTLVLLMTMMVVSHIMIFEFCLHKAAAYLRNYPKYHEILTKVFGELMTLGLMGFVISIFEEFGAIKESDKVMVAFQAADHTIFILAIGLIVQAIVIFLRQRSKNILIEKAEVTSSQHLLELAARHRRPGLCGRLWNALLPNCFSKRQNINSKQNDKRIRSRDLDEAVNIRILRHYFLSNYGLPELFPFSKYLRQSQGNQVSHLIEVKLTTWMLLLPAAWAIDMVSKLIENSADMKISSAIAVSYAIFSYFSVVVHAAINAYFKWAIRALMEAATGGRARNSYDILKKIADGEAATVGRECGRVPEAIEIMKRVLDQHTVAKSKTRGIKNALLKRLSSRNESNTPDIRAGKPLLRIRFFSCRVWHFLVILSLMINALYFALFCQCVLYQMSAIYDEIGYLAIMLAPLPQLINMVVIQPRILRDFILISSIIRIDDAALSDVIDHFTESINAREAFVRTVRAFLLANNMTLDDIGAQFERRDTAFTGRLEVEDVRLVLYQFGFKLSYFQFNIVANLLFNSYGGLVEYERVLTLLAVDKIGDDDLPKSTRYTTNALHLTPTATAPSPYLIDSDTSPSVGSYDSVDYLSMPHA